MLTLQQVAAMQIARIAGKELAQKHPEIAKEYRDGANYEDLGDKYLLELSSKNRRNGIGYAIRALIDEEELRAMDKLRRKKVAKKLGLKTKKNGTGIFGISKKKKKEFSKKGVKASNIAQGKIPYENTVRVTEFGKMTEEEYLKKLVLLGKCNYRTMTKLVNALFENNRTYSSIQQFGSRFRRKIKTP